MTFIGDGARHCLMGTGDARQRHIHLELSFDSLLRVPLWSYPFSFSRPLLSTVSISIEHGCQKSGRETPKTVLGDYCDKGNCSQRRLALPSALYFKSLSYFTFGDSNVKFCDCMDSSSRSGCSTLFAVTARDSFQTPGASKQTGMEAIERLRFFTYFGPPSTGKMKGGEKTQPFNRIHFHPGT